MYSGVGSGESQTATALIQILQDPITADVLAQYIHKWTVSLMDLDPVYSQMTYVIYREMPKQVPGGPSGKQHGLGMGRRQSFESS